MGVGGRDGGERGLRLRDHRDLDDGVALRAGGALAGGGGGDLEGASAGGAVELNRVGALSGQ